MINKWNCFICMWCANNLLRLFITKSKASLTRTDRMTLWHSTSQFLSYLRSTFLLFVLKVHCVLSFNSIYHHLVLILAFPNHFRCFFLYAAKGIFQCNQYSKWTLSHVISLDRSPCSAVKFIDIYNTNIINSMYWLCDSWHWLTSKACTLRTFFLDMKERLNLKVFDNVLTRM